MIKYILQKFTPKIYVMLSVILMLCLVPDLLLLRIIGIYTLLSIIDIYILLTVFYFSINTIEGFRPINTKIVITIMLISVLNLYLLTYSSIDYYNYSILNNKYSIKDLFVQAIEFKLLIFMLIYINPLVLNYLNAYFNFQGKFEIKQIFTSFYINVVQAFGLYYLSSRVQKFINKV